MTTAPDKPLPFVTVISQPFWEGTRRHEFLLQQCRGCGAVQFPPKEVCSSCWSAEFGWTGAAGTGTVYTYTVIYRAGMPAFQDDVPYPIVIVELDEGPRVMSNLVNCDLEQVAVGMPVRMVWEDRTDEISMYKFEPAR